MTADQIHLANETYSLIRTIITEEEEQQRRLVRLVNTIASTRYEDDTEQDTPFLRDLFWMDDHESDLKTSIDAASGVVGYSIVLMGEWATAYKVLMHQDVPLVVPSGAIVRGLMENVLRTCHLLEPDLPPARRVARLTALVLAQMNSYGRSWEKINEESAPVHRERMEREIADKEAEGFSFEYDSKDRLRRVGFAGEVAPVSVKITDLADIYMPRSPESYSYLSAAAHSEIWRSDRSQVNTASAAALHTIQAVEVTRAWTISITAYLGLNNSEHLVRLDSHLFSLATQMVKIADARRI